MTVPVVTLVGYSNTGKTTLGAALVKTFTEWGYRVATIKHASHGHEPSPVNKDSSRYWDAGVQEVVVSSPGMVTHTLRRTDEALLDQLVARLTGRPDLVIAEGFKTSMVPKVLIAGPERIDPLPVNIIAVVGDQDVVPDVPVFESSDVISIAAHLKKVLFEDQESCGGGAAPGISLVVDAMEVVLKEFPAAALNETLRGFLRSLKNVPREAKTIEVRLQGD